MQSPPLIQSANVPSSSKSDHRYQSSLIVDYPLLAQRGQVSGQPPIAHVQQYERACPVPTTTLNQPSGVDAVYYRDYPLLAQRGQVSWQPPIAHVQPYRRACAVPTAALEQPLGVNAVCYRPTVDVPVVAQYHVSPHSCSILHNLIHGFPMRHFLTSPFPSSSAKIVGTGHLRWMSLSQKTWSTRRSRHSHIRSNIAQRMIT